MVGPGNFVISSCHVPVEQRDIGVSLHMHLCTNLHTARSVMSSKMKK